MQTDRKNNPTHERISVIIPFYNSEEYLRRCVDSIIAQTYRQLEILLIDDGSEDSSGSIARELEKADERIISVRLPHGGVSEARNAGLERASGDYVLFVDSDDWMKTDIIERMMDAMRKEDADLVTCDLAYADYPEENVRAEKKTDVEICDREEYLRIFFKIGTNESIYFPVAKLYKRSLLPRPLYPRDIRVGEDVSGTYRAIVAARKIVRIREVGYYYFRNPGGATGSFTEKNFDLLKVWDGMLQLTEGREPDHTYAILNRRRIDFGLLFRMITEIPAAEIKRRFGEQQKQLLTDLKKHEKQLLRAPIVFSRKLLIFGMCHMYPVMAFFGNIHVRLRRHSRKETGLSRRKLS